MVSISPSQGAGSSMSNANSPSSSASLYAPHAGVNYKTGGLDFLKDWKFLSFFGIGLILYYKFKK